MRTVLFASLCLAFAVAGILRGADEPDKKPQVVMRIYDVAATTQMIPDFPGPNMDLVPTAGSQQNLNNGFMAAAPQPSITTTSIADMIRNRVNPESWDPNVGTSIEERGGMLVVMQTPGIHAVISDLIAKLTKDQHRPLCVQALLVDVEQSALLPFLGKCGKEFTEEDVHAVLKKGKLRATPQLTVLNTQRTHVLSGRKVSYIADYDISGDTPDPVIGEAIEGIAMDVKPVLSNDARAATVEMRLSSNENVTIEKTDGVVFRALPAKSAKPEAKDAAAPVKEEHGASVPIECPIQKAALDTRHLRTSLECKLGRWTLASILPPIQKAGEKLAPGKSTLVFLLVDKAE